MSQDCLRIANLHNDYARVCTNTAISVYLQSSSDTLHMLDDLQYRLEAEGLRGCHIRQHLAIQLDARAVHLAVELRVRKSFLARACIDFLDPKRAHVLTSSTQKKDRAIISTASYRNN